MALKKTVSYLISWLRHSQSQAKYVLMCLQLTGMTSKKRGLILYGLIKVVFVEKMLK